MSMFRPEGYIQFFRTLPHDCGYLPNRRASNAVVDPALAMEPWLYTRLAEIGFRRSGPRVYRPACSHCNACTPLRLPVADFSPSRTQRRILQRNRDLEVTVREAVFDEAHFELYCRYISSRHADSDMETMRADEYLAFLTCPGIETRFLDFRLAGRCVTVAAVDVLANALSAVYTFFDPDLPRRSLGANAILREIATARLWGKD
jgi:leucyl-tRNA---protein transferase